MSGGRVSGRAPDGLRLPPWPGPMSCALLSYREMSCASSGRSSRAGGGRSTTVPPLLGGVGSLGGAGSGARAGAGAFGTATSGRRAGTSGSLAARSGTGAGGSSSRRTATGVAGTGEPDDGDSESEVNRSRPSTSACKSTDRHRKSRSRDGCMSIHKSKVLISQAEAAA